MNNHAEESVVIRNIYYMMAYAYRALSVGEYTKLASEKFESANDFPSAFKEKRRHENRTHSSQITPQ